jgi:hypothetical protein
VFLDAAEGLIQRQFRRVERLNGLDVQNRHAGIKARGAGNEKCGERFLPPRSTGYFTFSTTSDLDGHVGRHQFKTELIFRRMPVLNFRNFSLVAGSFTSAGRLR